MEKKIDILKITRKHLALILLLPLVAVAVCGFLNYRVFKPVYESTTILMVGKPLSGSEMSVQYNTIMANKQLVKTYAEIAKSRSVLEAVKAETNTAYNLTEMRRRIEVGPLRDTQLIEIRVQDADPMGAFTISSAMSRIFSQRVIEIMQVDNVAVVDSPETPEMPVKPKKIFNMAATGILSLFFALGLAFYIESTSEAIETWDQAGELMGLPVLGIIPNIERAKGRTDSEAVQNYNSL